MTVSTSVIITAAVPAGRPITFALLGGAAADRAGAGVGGWQITDRPRRRASTEWVDAAPLTMTLPLLLTAPQSANLPFAHHTAPGPSVEAQIGTVESWELAAPGGIQPPVLTVRGPVPHTDLRWVVKALTWDTASVIRGSGGQRTYQELSLTLLEYVPATVSFSPVSPAKAAAQRQAVASSHGVGPSGRTYIVRSGDTLSGIAARHLGDYRKYTQIAALNHIRDPNMIRVGQRLVLPA